MANKAAEELEIERLNRRIRNLKSEVTVLQKREVEKDQQIAVLKNDLASAQNNAMADARARDFKDVTPPEGYVLVPVEPTQEMLDAGTQALIDTLEDKVNGIEPDGDGRKAQYKAMLSEAEVKPVTVELPTVLLPKDTDKITKA